LKVLKLAAPSITATLVHATLAIQRSIDRMCVLKIKPPLCLDTDGADFFADTLDRVLAEGW